MVRLLHDKEFETFQSVEQFCECDSEPMVSPQLLAEEDYGQDGGAPFGALVFGW